MKICIVVGTRPEIIKMSPIIKHCIKNNLDFFVLHTGQHYNYNLDGLFFEELQLPQPKYNLNVGSRSHCSQISKILADMESILEKEKPDVLLVEGDTNTVLASALAASKMKIILGHVESGLRSYDFNMHEEHNRIATDHLSDWLFAPTQLQADILLKEGIFPDQIVVTGNTIVDALNQNIERANQRTILQDHGLQKQKYFLLTAHRAETTDDPDKLQTLIKGIEDVSAKFGIPVIYPVHPRTKARMDEFNIKINESIKLIDPVSFLDFLKLEANAAVVITDSGGAQEESCILKVPCVTLRKSTERPETVEVGGNIIAGIEPKAIMDAVEKMMSSPRDWKNPFGDGTAAEQIMAKVMTKKIVARRIE